ncbi:MAG TPA: hypothetical protein VF310_15000 [Vicinamibacteria bacterium]
MRFRAAALAFAAYALLTAAALWPLPAAPARLVIPNDDMYGNVYAMAWVAHQAVRDPLHLFAANVFQPHPWPLAFMESLIPQALLAGPLLWAGGPPLLAHNLVLLLTFPLCGLAAYLLARELDASPAGAFLAGLAYAFCAYRYAQVVNIQTLSMQWLPLAVLFTRRACRSGRWAHAAAAGAFFLLQALSSGYYAVLGALAVGLTVLWHARQAVAPRTRLRLGVSLGLAAALVGLVFLPYRWAMAREQEVRGYAFERSLEDMVNWSARPSSYLSPSVFAALPHQRWLESRFGGGSAALYPTLAVVLLAGAAAAWRWRQEPARFAALLAVSGVLLSLGPVVRVGPWSLPGPFALVRWLPGVSMLRIPARMGVLALLGLACLAALGLDELARRVRRPRAVAAAALILLALEAYPHHLGGLFRPDPTPPPTVRWLAAAPRGLVLELPWDHETMGYGGRYIYWSTRHWQPMVNGWGGFYPKGPFELGVLGKLFPGPHAAEELRRAGVRYVVVHVDFIPADRPGRRARALAEDPLPEGVRLAARFGPHLIYELEPLAAGG